MTEPRDPAQNDSSDLPEAAAAIASQPNTEPVPAADAAPSSSAEPVAAVDAAPATDAAPSTRASVEEDLSAGPGNVMPRVRHSDADDDVGNRIDEDEEVDDDIGNRVDAPSGDAQATPQPTQGGAKRKRRRKKKHVDGAAPGASAHPVREHSREDSGPRRAFQPGDKVRAKIVEVTDDVVIVDLWGKERAAIDVREFLPDAPSAVPSPAPVPSPVPSAVPDSASAASPEPEPEPAPDSVSSSPSDSASAPAPSSEPTGPVVGDGVDVIVLHGGAPGIHLVVTTDPSVADRSRVAMTEAFERNEPVDGIITGVNRGGLEVDLRGVRAFCPSSQIDARYPPSVDPRSLVLTRHKFMITSIAQDGREAVVSRRVLIEQEVRERAEEARGRIEIGSVVKGRVISVKDYGVFVDLGGIEGLIHITELSQNRGLRPSDVCRVGDEIEAKVLRITGGTKPGVSESRSDDDAHDDHAAGESEAAAHEGPHDDHAEREAQAAAEEAGVTDATESAEGEAGDDAAVSAVESTESIAAGEDHAAVPEGETSVAKTAAEKPRSDERRKNRGRDRDKDKYKKRRGLEGMPRVILSRRAIEPDPWADIHARFPVGSVRTGKVARMQPFGAFIELEPGIDGLLHVSELGDGKRLEHPNEVLKDGQTVNVRVERLDRGAKRISLSVVPEGVTEEQMKKAIVPKFGMIVQAVVVGHDNLGVWAQIKDCYGKNGRALIAPPDTNQQRGTDLRRAMKIGTEVRAKVVEVDRGRLRISVKAAAHEDERSAYRAYQKEATSKTVGVSLADKLRAKLGLQGGSTGGKSA